ncbi:tetratricopeptide repeat protein [uncultured Sutterella sp.]|uniref:tetratricopeptide repeat protein n=1 Tax=uncultured Sutterella sp. TaxID=286133 RepID=UPI00260DA129|nr:tetratricopeptide repeat protein [uncultured Sutterella sp.]
MATPKGRIFTDADREELDALDDGNSMYAWRMEHLIDEKIAKGVSEGRFTEEEAAEDLETALRLSYALNNMDSYEKYVRSVKVLRRAEKNAAGSGAYWYRLGAALNYLGKIEEAKEAADRAVAEEPDYPWGWLLLGRLCAHLGLRSEAEEAQKRGLALVPDDPEFLMLGEDIERGADLAQMEYHLIDPEADKALREDALPSGELLEKIRSCQCILIDPEGLAAAQRALPLKDWKPADPPEDPFCRGVFAFGKGEVEIVFRMNEAGFSHMPAWWLAGLARLLPSALESFEKPRLVEVQQNRIVAVYAADEESDEEVVRYYDLSHISTDDSSELRSGGDGGEYEPGEKALLEKVEALNELSEYQGIIDLLEALPPEKRTWRLSGELARAYNNLAEPGDDELFERAIEILGASRSAAGSTFLWNYRMGYALYFLDRDGEALRFFEKALEKKPGDEDAIARLEAARRGVTFPIFLKPFRNRLKLVWRRFSEEAAVVLDLLREGRLVEANERAERIFHPVAMNWGFGLGLDEDGRGLLFFSPKGRLSEAFPLVHFADRMPEALTEKWSLKLGRGPGIQVGSGAFRSGIRPEELTLWVDLEDSGWRVSFYAESFRGISQEDAPAIFEDLGTMIEDAVGEAASMRLVRGISIMKAKRDEPGIRMNDLARWFHEHIPTSKDFDMRQLIREKLEFWLKPDPRAQELYFDIGPGFTQCAVFMNEYRADEAEAIDAFQRIGAAAGFLAFEFAPDLDREARDEAERRAIADFKAAMAEFSEEGIICGEAQSKERAYVEVMLWDSRVFLSRAAAWLEGYPAIERALFRTWRRRAGNVILKAQGEG